MLDGGGGGDGGMMSPGMDGYAGMEGMGSESWGQHSYTPKPVKPGDWFCPSCGDHQFSRNMQCRKCGTPNPMAALGDQQWQMFAGAGGMGFGDGGYGGCGGKGRRQLPGDWVCPNCGDYQFAKNVACRRCQTPNPNPDPMQQALASGAYGGGAKPLKPGDWMCQHCGDHQFARNQVCRRCGTPGPNSNDNMGGHRTGPVQKPGDWFCPNCSDLQFARNTHCKRCGTPNPNPTSASGTSYQMKPGDWLCPACGDLQFARNAQCRKCGAGNPDPSGMSNGTVPMQKHIKPGDWSCPSCGDHQFAKNTHCRRCGTPYPGDSSGCGGIGDWGSDGGKGWDCDGCGLGMQKGMAKGQPWDSGFQNGYAPVMCGKGQMMGKGCPGDHGGKPTSWKCPNCNELVFARNNECKSCGTSRPATEEGSVRSAPY